MKEAQDGKQLCLIHAPAGMLAGCLLERCPAVSLGSFSIALFMSLSLPVRAVHPALFYTSPFWSPPDSAINLMR